MAVIEKRTGKNGIQFRVKVRVRGRPVETATFKRLTDAKNWAQITEGAIRDGKYFRNTEAKRRTFGEMIDRYIELVLPLKPKSTEKQTLHLRWWKKQLGDYFLIDVTPAMIAEQRDKLLNTPFGRRRVINGTAEIVMRKRSPATAVRYLAALSHCYTIAMKEWGWVDDTPVRRVTRPKEPRGRVRFLSDEERKVLLVHCKEHSNPYIYPVVVLALSTGMRQGEIMNLKWDDIDLERGRLTLHETKNGERRVVPLTGYAKELMCALATERSKVTNLVFPATIPQRAITERPTYAPMFVRKAWYEALDRAGIKDFRFHDLRHSAASYLAMNGATISEIAEVLGHKTLQMVKRYTHLSEAHTAKIVEAMNKQIFG